MKICSKEHSVSAESSLPARELKGEILLVDDNLDLLSTLAAVLENAGLQVLQASGAVEALGILEDNQPDMIISDVKMEGMDGYEFHRKVQESVELCHIPFLFLSALSDPSEIRKGKSYGCDDYMVKPFHPDDLIAVILGKLSVYRIRRTLNEEAFNQYCKGIIQRLSHEFRTPLVAVNTGAELLKMKLSSTNDNSLIELGDSILRGGNRLQHLLEDFMTLQQIESGKAKALWAKHRKPEPFAELVKRSVDHLKNFTLPETAVISCEISEKYFEDNLYVDIFEMQFADSLRRILENSLKFAGEEKEVQVSIASRAVGTISVLLRDFGPGLNKEDLARASQLFGQICRDKVEQQGCGLGITISSYFTELNGGEARFQSPGDGEGLEVELRYPLVEV